jgi:hypothetical protein
MHLSMTMKSGSEPLSESYSAPYPALVSILACSRIG